MNVKKVILSLMLGMVMLLISGCDPQGERTDISSSSSVSSSSVPSPKPPVSHPASTSHKKVENKTMEAEIYYPNEDGTRLLAAKRKITVGEKDKYTAVMEALLESPKEPGVTSIFPKNAKLRSVKVKDGTAEVDFDGRLVKTFVGGSTGEELLVGSVVNTLTNFPEVKRVSILLDGKPVETLSGHMDLTAPIERMEHLLK